MKTPIIRLLLSDQPSLYTHYLLRKANNCVLRGLQVSQYNYIKIKLQKYEYILLKSICSLLGVYSVMNQLLNHQMKHFCH